MRHLWRESGLLLVYATQLCTVWACTGFVATRPWSMLPRPTRPQHGATAAIEAERGGREGGGGSGEYAGNHLTWSPCEEPGIVDFKQWMSRCGVKHPKLEIAVSEGGLRGFVAKEDIEAGELLVSVPWSATLRAEGRAPSQHIVSREYWAKAPWDVKLAARVAEERRRGRFSRFKQYIDTLDAFPTVPCPHTVSCPGYPSLAEAAQERREYWSNQYELLTCGVTGNGVLTREEFEWGMGVVKSRAFSPCNSVTGRVERGRNGRGGGEGGKRIALEIASLAYGWFEGLTGVEIRPISLYLARRLVPQRIQSHALLPGIDMSNHRTSVIPRLTTDLRLGETQLRTPECSWSKGDHVVISYGPKTSSDLLLNYGFVEESNVADDCVLDLSKLLALESNEEVQARLEALGDKASHARKAVSSAVLRPRIMAEHGPEAFFSTLGNVTAEERAKGEGHALGGGSMAVLRYLLEEEGRGRNAGKTRLGEFMEGVVGTAREEKALLERLKSACWQAEEGLAAAVTDQDGMVVSFGAEKRRVLEGYRAKLSSGIGMLERREAADDGRVTR